MSMSEFFSHMKLSAQSAGDHQLSVTFGELSAYYPSDHTAKFLLPLHRDNRTDQPLEVGPLQVGTIGSGAGFGVQFVPPTGAQALIIYVDAEKIYPIAAVFLFNDIEAPPYPAGDTNGWKDRKGNGVFTNDAGRAELLGTVDAAVVAPKVGLGDVFANLGADNAVVTVGMLRTAVTAVFNSHTHPGVATGAGTTAAPTTQMTPTGSATIRATQ